MSGFPLIAVLLWSGNAIVSKLAAASLAPATIAFYRCLLAWLLLTPWLARPLWRQRQALRPYLGKICLLALLGMVLNQTLGYYAAVQVSAVNMGIHNALIPLMTVLLSLWLLKEGPTLGALFGTLISLVGLVWLLGEGHPARLLAQGIGRGDLLMLLAVFSYALYGVLFKRWALPLSGWQFVYLQMTAALIWLLPDFLRVGQWQLAAVQLPLILYAAIPATLLGSWCWLEGVRRLGASRTAIYMNLLPLFTAVIAVLLLGERLAGFHLVGGGLTLAGVILCQWWRQPLRQPPLPATA